VSGRLERTLAELRAAEAAARAGDGYDAARDLDCAAAELLANQKADTTISSWTASNRETGKRWACVFCALLTIGANIINWRRVTRDHCAEALSRTAV
jgi:hypothetical protein